jgi:hypothetical protein
MIKMSHEKPSAVEPQPKIRNVHRRVRRDRRGKKEFSENYYNIFLSFPLCPLRPLWYIFREFAEAHKLSTMSYENLGHEGF